MRFLILLVLFPILAFSQKQFPADFRINGPKIGAAFEPGNLIALNDSIVDFNALSSKVIYINFWFIGCQGCKMEEAYLKQLADSVKDNPDILILNFVPNEAGRIKKYTARNNTYEDFLIFPMRNFQAIEKLFNIKTYPTHLIINNNVVVENFTVPLSSKTTTWLIDRLESETRKIK